MLLIKKFGKTVNVTDNPGPVSGLLLWAVELIPWYRRQAMLVALLQTAYEDAGIELVAGDTLHELLRLLQNGQPTVEQLREVTPLIRRGMDDVLQQCELKRIPTDISLSLSPYVRAYIASYYAGEALIRMTWITGTTNMTQGSRWKEDSASATAVLKVLIWTGSIAPAEERATEYAKRFRLVMSVLALGVADWIATPQEVA